MLPHPVYKTFSKEEISYYFWTLVLTDFAKGSEDSSCLICFMCLLGILMSQALMMKTSEASL